MQRCLSGVPPIFRVARVVLPAFLVSVSVGCGRIDFGDDLSNTDNGAGDDPTLDEEPPPIADPSDGGAGDPPPVSGDPEPLGCTEFDVAPAVEFVLERTEAGYREAFGDFAISGGCAASFCHGGGNINPFLPDDSAIGSDFEQAIDSVWALMADSVPVAAGETPSGGIWAHHPGFAPAPVPPEFAGEDPINAINEALIKVEACNIAQNAPLSDPECDTLAEGDPIPDGVTCYCPSAAPVPATCVL